MATERTRIRRVPNLGRYDRETIDAVLDDALVGHVGFVGSDGHPYVIPMAVARRGDELLLHGSTASRLMRGIAGQDVCVTVTHLDGLVVALSVFESSMNYRSVVVLGRARVLTDRAEKLAGLRALVEHLLPGRWDEVRPSSEKELKATTLIAVSIDEASAKVRTGPPDEEEVDPERPVWAGVVPLRTVALDPVPDVRLSGTEVVPESVKAFAAKRSGRG